MKITDLFMPRPVAVSFGRRGGGVSGVLREADSIFLVSDGGAAIEIAGASGDKAGVLTAGDRARLDTVAATGGTVAAVETAAAAAALALPATIGALRFGAPTRPALYRRTAAEPAHPLKLRTADRFRADGVEDSAAGGWWEFEPAPEIDVTTVGVCGDGTTDNAPALAALRDFCVAKGRDRHWRWIFPAAEAAYRTSSNKWMIGLTDLALSGYGATLQNVSASTSTSDYAPLPRECIFRGNGLLDTGAAGSTLVVQSGQRFDTAAAGAQTLTMTTGAEAALYAAGDRVFVHGFCTQAGGYSPNLRFFEWHEVASVNAGAGTVTLKRPLAHDYNADWPDVWYREEITTAAYPALAAGEKETFFGKPRILRLSGRPQADGTLYHYPRRVVIEGFRFLKHPTVATQNWLEFGAEEIVFRDLDLGYLEGADDLQLAPKESRIAIAERCRVGGVIEIDKLIEHCTVTGCDVDGDAGSFSSITGGSGCRHLTIEACTTRRRINAVALTSLTLRANRAASHDMSDNATNGPVMMSSSFTGQTALIAGNSYLRRPSQVRIGTNGLIGEQAVASVGPSGEAQFARIVNGAGRDTDVPDAVRALAPGHVAWLKSDPRIRGIVADIVDDGAGAYRVRWASGNLRHALTPGAIIQWPRFMQIDAEGTDALARLAVQNPNPGLLNWQDVRWSGTPASFTLAGVTLSGNGAGATNEHLAFPGILRPGRSYQLTYDMARTAGVVYLRASGSGSNLASLSTSGTGLTVTITVNASADTFQIWHLAAAPFNGTFTPLKLVEL